MAPIFTSPVEKTIDQQLQALEREKRALQKAKQALKAAGGGGGRKPSSETVKPHQRQRAGKETRAEQALNWIKGHPGTTAAEISEAIGVSRPHAYQLISRLRAEGAINPEGGEYKVRSSGARSAEAAASSSAQ